MKGELNVGSVAIFKGKLVKFLAKAGILVPARPDADRSLVPAAGETAFNTTANKLEVYDGSSWVQLGAGGTGNGLVHPTTNSTFESGTPNIGLTGTGNTAIGVSSGTSIVNGASNTIFGSSAGASLVSGSFNTFVGTISGIYATGNRNTFVGRNSGGNIGTGDYNTFVGQSAGPALLTGSNNTLLGGVAYTYVTDGTGNVVIGYFAGSGLTAASYSYNTIINSDGAASTQSASYNGAVVIGKDNAGNSSIASADNQFVLGTTNHKYNFPGITETSLVLGPIGTSSGQTGTLSFRELSANGVNSVTLRAPDSIVSDVVLTLPNTAGSANQALTTDGTGSLSWASPSAFETISSTSLGSISNRNIILTAATAITATDIVNCTIYVQNDVALNVTGNITGSRIFSATPSTAYTGGVAILSATSTFNFTGRGIVGTYIYWAQDININTTNRVDILESQIKCARYVNDNNNFVRVINANTTVEAQRYTHNGTSSLSISNLSTIYVSDFLLVGGSLSINSGAGLKCSQLFDTGSSTDINTGWIDACYYQRTSGTLSFTVQNSTGFARIGYFQNLGTVTASSLRALSEGTLTIGCLRTANALSVSTTFSGTITVGVIHNASSAVNTAPANSRNFISHNDVETWFTSAGVFGSN